MDEYYNQSPINSGDSHGATDTALDDVFGLRKKTLERKMQLLQEQIEQRKKNLEQNTYEIDLDLCRCGTIIENLPYGDREGCQRIVLMHKLPLHREKRKQQTEYLRDTAMLRRELLDTILQYQSLEDKKEMLD
jgi:hypothetical protein